ncbi:hypothetical protein K502DRAFT_342951 [Neoconidiobolus thromboides FSU 785]|nr:hypothetical protein K502DRAFT_342951 [Neoconidiobolus thromboides FSU 785]
MGGQDKLLDDAKKFRRAIASQEVFSKPVIRPMADKYGLNRGKGNKIQSLAEEEEKKQKAEERKRMIKESQSKGIAPKASMSSAYEAIELLKRTREPKTIKQIIKELNLDEWEEAGLYSFLTGTDKATHNLTNDTFEFKPDHDVKNCEDLLRIVHSQYRDNLNGEDDSPIAFEMKKLIECAQDPIPFAEELLAKNQVYAFRGKEQVIKNLYYNTYTAPCELASEFKNMWKKLKIPDEADLISQMEKKGLRTMETFVKKELPEDTKPIIKKPRQSNRKQKVTNTHLL